MDGAPRFHISQSQFHFSFPIDEITGSRYRMTFYMNPVNDLCRIEMMVSKRVANIIRDHIRVGHISSVDDLKYAVTCSPSDPKSARKWRNCGDGTIDQLRSIFANLDKERDSDQMQEPIQKSEPAGLVDINDLATRLGVTAFIARSLMKSGLPYFKLNDRVIRFDMADVNAWLSLRRVSRGE